MFSFFRRARPQGTVRKNRFVFRWEGLEGRDCPSTLVQPTSTTLTSATVVHEATHPVHNQKPVISGLTYQEKSNGQYTVSGKVTDDQSVAGLIVTFHGMGGVNGQTAVVQPDGSFSMTFSVKGHGHHMGTIHAHTVDALGKGSNTASVYFNPVEV
jgi:hypothetical protein